MGMLGEPMKLTKTSAYTVIACAAAVMATILYLVVRGVTAVNSLTASSRPAEITERYSPAELSELFLQAQSMADTQFQYWITVTFAVLVAGFVARERLSARLRNVIAFLYVIATCHFWLRLGTLAIATNDIFVALEQSRAILFHEESVPTMMSRLVLLTVGTIAAVYFLVVARDGPQSDRES